MMDEIPPPMLTVAGYVKPAVWGRFMDVNLKGFDVDGPVLGDCVLLGLPPGDWFGLVRVSGTTFGSGTAAYCS